MHGDCFTPVAGESRSPGWHRGTDHGSTRTGLNTTSIETVVHHSRLDLRCKMCKHAPETVQQITAGCKTQAGRLLE